MCELAPVQSKRTAIQRLTYTVHTNTSVFITHTLYSVCVGETPFCATRTRSPRCGSQKPGVCEPERHRRCRSLASRLRSDCNRFPIDTCVVLVRRVSHDDHVTTHKHPVFVRTRSRLRPDATMCVCVCVLWSRDDGEAFNCWSAGA